VKVVFLILISICLFSADQIVSREGDVVTVVSSGEYIMGDSDNRKESRTMALTQAKVNASEIAGTYIESNFESVTKQTNGDTVDKVTKQELRSFSAAILQSEIVNDTMEILANKTTIYKVSIKAHIDLATLRERVKQLGEDKAKKDQLVYLEKKNKELSSTIETLSRQMRTLENAKSVKPEKIKALREERDRVFTKLEKNEGAVRLVFEKASVVNEYEQKVEFSKNLYETINETIYKHITDFFTLTLDKPIVVDRKGDEYEVKLNFAYEVDREKMHQVLNEDSIKTYWGNRGYGDDLLYLDLKQYDDIVKKLINSFFKEKEKNICILFSIPGGGTETYIGDIHGTDGMYRPAIFIPRRSRPGEENSIYFTTTQKQMSTIDVIDAKIGFCKKDDYY
jgi:hypothetical protein